MDRQEIIILFIVAVIAAIGLFLVYSANKTIGDTTYPQFEVGPGASCYVDSDCYWAYNDLNYECRGGFCRPKGAIGPPQYEPKLKLR
ncbi:hypothetical protein JW851_02780 [Candidatus Woesearchaeota archaeon]|nr:hypothetical protein [Candidatus Woesearchaeota archaeon]